MPQMMPMYWSLMLIFIIMFLISISSMIYFMHLPLITGPKKNHPLSPSPASWSWMW